jgi:ABC-type dipeptide/oligopeptide/nickel transport system ATPase component
MLMQLSDEIGMTVIFITHEIGLAPLNTCCAVKISKGDT